MKACCIVFVLVVLLSPGPIEGQVPVTKLLNNGDLSISLTGTPEQNYVVESAGSLIPPITWTPLRTNLTDPYGLVSFTNTPANSHEFYRVRFDPSVPPPLVYVVENTGANCAAPPLPAFGNLPWIQLLPDPFLWADGSGRSTNFADWKCRRAEIKAQIENYEIGIKPTVNPANIFASYSAGTLTVRVTNVVSGTNRILTLTCAVLLPSGDGPFPAVIGMNSLNGSIPSSLFTNRNIARIAFTNNQVTTYGNQQNTDPYYKFYGPDLNSNNTGQYSAWAWGVSRIIDGLQLVTNSLPIDLKHLCVTGCSYAGKQALFAGALDERIALTIAQESGGGGATSWRYSHTEPAGGVESLENTDHNWFSESMFQFGGNNVSYLPVDHHELMAMCAPRALFVTGNPDYTWLSNPSCYVCSRATQQIYTTLGISDRFGFSIIGGHAHCALPASEYPAVGAFLDKFLLGDTNANTSITTHPPSYDSIDYAQWYQWWGIKAYTIMLEAECGTVGTNWNVLTNVSVSNAKYVTAKSGLTSITNAPADAAGWLTLPFSVTNSGTFYLVGRLNTPLVGGDSFWVKMDGGSWTSFDGLGTGGAWQWKSLGSHALTEGSHTLYIGYRESGALLDKLSLSTSALPPSGLGQSAQNLCP